MIKIIDKQENKLTFSSDMSISLANAIRRSVLEIPTLAIDNVEIVKNDSALYDEIIAHRLGLVPLKNEKLNLREECTCKGKGCGKCTYSMKLQAKGPGNVYSDDMKPKTNIIYKMPITLLSEGQEMELIANAKLGFGKEHAKYSPGLLFYRNAANIKIKNDSEEGLIGVCPQKVFESSNGKVKVKSLDKCDLCMACVEKYKDAVEVSENEELMFFIESWGQMEAKEIFTNSVDALNKNLKDLSKQVK